MSNEASAAIQGDLAPDEPLLWSGQPRQGIFLRASDAFLIPFSVLWGGFAVFWEGSVLSANAPFFFKLWGIPFVLVGLYIAVGRFFFDAWQRTGTFYGVTPERVIIISRWPTRKVKSITLRTISDLSLEEGSDGRGSISFGPNGPFPSWMSNSSWPGMAQHSAPAFDSIDDARSVYEIVRTAQRATN